MRTHRLSPSLFSVAALALVAIPASAGQPLPAEWTFQLQCRSSLDPAIPAFNLPQTSSLSSQSVVIDDDGTVAIRAFIGSGGITEGIFVGSDGVGGLALTVNSPDPFWTTQMGLRNGLLSVGDGGFNGGATVYDTDGNTVQRFDIGGSQGTSGFGTTLITSDGAICYRGDFGFVGDKTVVDEFIDGVRTQRLVADSFTGDFDFLLAPKINDARQVAMNTLPVAGPSRRIVRFEADNTPTTIAETGPVYNSFVNSIDLAQNGNVAFSARRTSDSIWTINYSDATTITQIASGDDPDINSSSVANFPPVVNSQGWVALRATDITNDATALWVGDGTDLVKLIEFGQLIDTDLGPIPLGFDFGGTTGKRVMNGIIDINDAGQVAFAAFLQNGTIGVFVATPVTDEPCVADLAEPFGELNFFDVAAYIGLYNAGDAQADLAEPFGALNFFDVSAFIGAYNAGCP